MYKVTIEDINDYLLYKRNLGFKYQTVEIQLKNFLKYYGIISDENIDKWINNIKFSNIYKKGLASTINEFIKYLISIKEIKNINLDVKIILSLEYILKTKYKSFLVNVINI